MYYLFILPLNTKLCARFFSFLHIFFLPPYPLLFFFSLLIFLPSILFYFYFYFPSSYILISVINFHHHPCPYPVRAFFLFPFFSSTHFLNISIFSSSFHLPTYKISIINFRHPSYPYSPSGLSFFSFLLFTKHFLIIFLHA